MSQQTINLAYIGSGSWAQKYHFPALSHIQSMAKSYNLNLYGITSLEIEVAEKVANEYGFDRVFIDIDELLADSAVNAIAVAVPPDAVMQVIEHIIHRKIPILSEKPPGISTEQSQYLADIVTVPNVVTFNRRFIPLNQICRDIVKMMDNITYIQGNFYRHHRLDESFMVGTGIHWINFIEYLFGSIKSIKTQRWKNPTNDSWLRTAYITFENGLKGFLKFFPCSGSDFERLEVHSNSQSVYLDGPLWVNPGSITIDKGKSQQIIKQPTPLPPEIIRLGIVAEYEAFFDLIINKTPSPSTFQNAVNSMRVAEAMEHGYNL